MNISNIQKKKNNVGRQTQLSADTFPYNSGVEVLVYPCTPTAFQFKSQVQGSKNTLEQWVGEDRDKKCSHIVYRSDSSIGMMFYLHI